MPPFFPSSDILDFTGAAGFTAVCLTLLLSADQTMAEQGRGEVRSMDTLLESTLDSVDEAETKVLEVAGEIGFDEDELHKIGMAVRECMVNAVVHGNRYNGRKKVFLGIQGTADRLTVTIRDEGEGFDMNALPDPLAEENLLRQSGRGLC